VSAHQAVYPIATMCRVLGVSPSGYYAWTKRSPSRRSTRDGVLIDAIRASHAASHGTYGAPRIQVDLATAGVCVSRKRIARLPPPILGAVPYRRWAHQRANTFA